MVKGKSLAEAVTINRDDVTRALGGLPDKKLHCSNLGTDALKAAINDYWRRNGHPDRVVALEDEHLEHEAEDGSACSGSHERGC
jgi:nitrogen fixation NifU-like protein